MAAVMEDLHTGKKRGIYSLDCIKLYVLREDAAEKDNDTVEMRYMRSNFCSWVLCL